MSLGIHPDHYAHFVSVFLVVALITYLTLVFAELFPKTVALRNPEKFAVVLSPFMQFISIVIYPLVFILSISVKNSFKDIPVEKTESVTCNGR